MLFIWGKYLNIQYFNICGNSKVGVWEVGVSIFAIFAVGGSLGHIHRLIGAQAACSLLQMSRFYMPGIPEGWKIMKLDWVQTNFKENNENRNWITKKDLLESVFNILLSIHTCKNIFSSSGMQILNIKLFRTSNIFQIARGNDECKEDICKKNDDLD